MSWDDLDSEILALFGEASHARGHTQNVRAQAAAKERTFEYGELSSSRGLDLRTSKKARKAEEREYDKYRVRKWKVRARGQVIESRSCPICFRSFDVTAWDKAYGKGHGCSPKCRRLTHSPDRLVRIGDIQDTLAGWAKRHGLTHSCVAFRVKVKGWSFEKAITTPRTPREERRWKGVVTFTSRAKEAGVPVGTVRGRMRKGLSESDALTVEKGMPGRFVNCVKRRAKAAGLCSRTVHERMKRGQTLEDALAPATPPGLRRWAKVNDTLKWRAERAGINYGTVHRRIWKLGWTEECALSTPIKVVDTKLFTYRGKTQSLYGWAKDRGLDEGTLRNRVRRGWPIRRVLTTPCKGPGA